MYRIDTINHHCLYGAVLLALLVLCNSAFANGKRHGQRYCTSTATAVLNACRSEVQDDFWIKQAQCINVAGRDERRECAHEAREERGASREECKDQYFARRDLCALLGEQRHNVDFSAQRFVDPDRIGVDVPPNAYFPLLVGRQWQYAGGDETVTVTVLDKIKQIDGVRCRVVRDVVHVDGILLEDTLDWFAQDVDGNVWYCGESVQDFETFAGDEPEDPELVSIECRRKGDALIC